MNIIASVAVLSFSSWRSLWLSDRFCLVVIDDVVLTIINYTHQPIIMILCKLH